MVARDRRMRPWLASTGALLLAGCMVGPDYQRPAPLPALSAIPAAYKEQQGFWKPGNPQDEAPRGDWWTIFQDPLLDKLIRQIDIDNQTLKASEAAYRDAVAILQQTESTLFPTVTASGSQRNSRGSTGTTGTSTGLTSFGTTGGTGSTTTVPTTSVGGGGGSVRSLYSLSASASWTIDVWGKIRRQIEGNLASAQVSAADLAAARLSAQAALASAYLQLRIQDELRRLLEESAAAYAQSLQIVRNQYAGGVASGADVAQAETQLRSTQAQAVNVGIQRAQLEHAIAVLVGLPPSALSIDPEPLTLGVPEIPLAVPSTLLERRPDIAAAERQMAAANAQIGVAVSAYYPDLTLSASVGYSGSILARLIQEPNQVWSVGPALAATIFDAGARSAQVAQARALWEQAVANYRQTVLTGFQQVEDQLAALRILIEQEQIQAGALESAREAERLILNQYRAGTVPYTNVIVAQTSALSAAQSSLTIRQSRLTASVSLLQALGGGWDARQLPTGREIRDTDPRQPLPVGLTRGETREAAR